MTTKTEHIVSVVGPGLEQKMLDFKMKMAALNAGYSSVKEWHPDVPEGWGSFPKAEFRTSEVYHGNAETFAYSHHQAVCKLNDRYIATWSNAPIHEDKPGQEVHYVISSDCRNWSESRVLVATDPAAQ